MKNLIAHYTAKVLRYSICSSVGTMVTVKYVCCCMDVVDKNYFSLFASFNDTFFTIDGDFSFGCTTNIVPVFIMFVSKGL